MAITGSSAAGTIAANYTYRGALRAGKHTFVITVVDLANASASTRSGTFTVLPTHPAISALR
jgi:hypothetical protein